MKVMLHFNRTVGYFWNIFLGWFCSFLVLPPWRTTPFQSLDAFGVKSEKRILQLAKNVLQRSTFCIKRTIKFRNEYASRKVWYSDWEEWKFISFLKELMYKNIVFDSDFKVKQSGMYSFMPHFQFKFLKDLNNSLPLLIAQTP